MNEPSIPLLPYNTIPTVTVRFGKVQFKEAHANSGENPFTCTNCNSSYSEISLKRHILTQ